VDKNYEVNRSSEFQLELALLRAQAN